MTDTLTLLVLTHQFPYGQDEQFLEAEVPYLAGLFARVIFLPQRTADTLRALPTGVGVADAIAGPRPGKLAKLAAGVWSACSSAHVVCELTSDPRLLTRPAALVRLLGVHRVGRALAGRLVRFIHAAGLDPAHTVLYAYWLDDLAYAAGLVTLTLPAITAVARAHSREVYQESATAGYIPFQAITLERLDAVFAISEFARQYLANRHPRQAPHCEVARLGVTDPGFDAVPSSDGTLRIFSCSCLESHKRIALLIHGLHALTRAHPGLPVEWHHIGDGSERAKLEELAGRLLPHTARWIFHGLVPNQAVREIYRTNPVDVFVNVSEIEGVPVSIMEAQSCGIPAVAPAISGMAEIVTAENGILLSADPSPKEIAGALARFARDPAHAERKASKAMWAERYSAADNYRAFINRLYALAHAHGG